MIAFIVGVVVMMLLTAAPRLTLVVIGLPVAYGSALWGSQFYNLEHETGFMNAIAYFHFGLAAFIVLGCLTTAYEVYEDWQINQIRIKREKRERVNTKD